MRVGTAEISDGRFRRYLLAFFCAAGSLFLWTPSRWLADSFRHFRVFDDAYPASSAETPAAPALGTGSGLLDRSAPRGEAAATAKKPRAVMFRLLAPAAQSVYLGASFNGFDARRHALTRRSDGLWEVAVDLPPGRYYYKFKVDGRWELDPTNPNRTPEPKTSSILDLQ
jgi:hypothetical protein